MDEDEPQSGLDIPKYVYHYHDVVDSEDRAAPLRLLDREGKAIARQEVLLEMLEQLRHPELTYSSDPMRAEEAKLCSGLIERLLASSTTPISEADPMAALILGYLYRGLTLPSEERYQAINQEALRLLRSEYSRGENSVKKVQEWGRKWMRCKARELWEEDEAQKKRVMDVTKEVQKAAQREAERLNKLGDNRPLLCWGLGLDTIRRNISKIAPDYAKQSGRPRKT